MSTRIYDAYRLKVEHIPIVVIARMREIAKKVVSEDPKILKQLHSDSFLHALGVAKEKGGNHYLARALAENAKGKLDSAGLKIIEDYMRIGIADPNLVVSKFNLKAHVGFDREYWYFKFNPTSSPEHTVLAAIVNEIKELEDFSYQNSCDGPEDVPEEEYNSRLKKWEELTAPNDNCYDMPLQCVIFDHFSLTELIRKNWYTGEELYSHLSYKFDVAFNFEVPWEI